MPLLELDEVPQLLSLLVYSSPGAGKTSLIASAANDERTSPVLIIDAGGNPISTRRKVSGKSAYNLANMRVFRAWNVTELNEIYGWIAKGQPLQASMARALKIETPFKTIAYDGVTDLQRQYYNLVQGITAEKGIGELLPKVDWPVYRVLQRQMIRFAMVMLQQLSDKLHVIVTALKHEETRGESPNTWRYAEPGLEGQAVEDVPGYARSVMHLYRTATATQLEVAELKAQVNIGSFEHTRFQYGKDQAGFGFTKIADPTITKLLNALENR